MRAWGIILAAGQGRRLAAATNGIAKQFLGWKGVPLYWHSARVFARCARIAGLVFVLPPDSDEHLRLEQLAEAEDPGIPLKVVAGGALRQDSVFAGLSALPMTCRDADHVLIHDAARPFVTPFLVNRVLDMLAEGHDGVIPGIPVTDTIKLVREDIVQSTPDRSLLRAVQTPQGFTTAVIRKAHERARKEGWEVTDDASLLERCGHAVRMVEGETGNCKLTRPEDLHMLYTAAPVVTPCTGFGYDVHRYVEAGEPDARPLHLGGILLERAPHVRAHSDGDVLLHALADALLGCCGQGDIGQLFPDTSADCDNLSSAIIVDEALQRTLRAGMEVVHADLTIIAEIPRIAPFRDEIRLNVARLLRLPTDRVGLKATTEEGMGFTGRKEGIRAVAVVTAIRSVPREQTD